MSCAKKEPYDSIVRFIDLFNEIVSMLLQKCPRYILRFSFVHNRIGDCNIMKQRKFLFCSPHFLHFTNHQFAIGIYLRMRNLSSKCGRCTHSKVFIHNHLHPFLRYTKKHTIFLDSMPTTNTVFYINCISSAGLVACLLSSEYSAYHLLI